MRIVYTNHALKKFAFLKELGWDVTPFVIDNILKHPSNMKKGYVGANIAIGSMNTAHDLRIVYSQVGDTITVVTFYPTKKGRI